MTEAATDINRTSPSTVTNHGGDAEGRARGRRLLRVSLLGILCKGVGVLLTFGSQLVLARALGVEAFGIYVTIVACVTVLALLGGLGMPLASVRFLAASAEQQDWPRYRGFISVSVTLTIVSSAVIGAATMLAFASVPGLRPMFPAMCVGVPMILLLSASGLASGTFLAAHKPLHAEVFGNVSRPFLIIAILGGAVALGIPMGAETALLLTVTTGVLVLGLQVAGLWGTVGLRWHGPRSTSDWRAWIASGIAFVLSTAAYSLMERLDTILLSTIVSPAVAAPYSVASRLAMLVGIALAPVSAMLGPVGAQLLARGDLRGLQRVLGQGSLLSTAAGVCLGGALVVVSPFLLGIFGKEFTAGHDVLVVLVTSQIILAMVGPAGFILAIAGHNTLLVATCLLTALLDIALCLILIPRYGATGAGVATMLSLSLNGLALAAITWWKLRVDTTLLAGIALLFQPKERLA